MKSGYLVPNLIKVWLGKTQTDELKSKCIVGDYLPNLSPVQCPLNKCALSESWGSSGVVVNSSESSNVDSLLSSVWTNHGAKKTHQVSSFWIRCPITIELRLHERTTVLESNCKCTYIQTFFFNVARILNWHTSCGGFKIYDWLLITQKNIKN